MTRDRKNPTRWAAAAIVMLFTAPLLVRCASIMTPSGGPKDTIPPVIVSMLPDNFTTNFNERKIVIEFDEYVQLKDQQKEFYTSPQMKKKPQLTIRGKGVVIQIKDTLKENTTYALNFGSALRDNNEGNPLNAMRYVFSTGPEIDSMILSGYTADSYKADSVPKSYIYFFIADSVEYTPQWDSTMFNHKPAVIARAENNGIFIAQNLKPIPYRVYAMQDTNDNQMYEPGTDQVGFLEGTYNPAELPDFSIWYDSIRQYPTAEPQLYLRMFTDAAFRRQLLQQTERPLQHKAVLYFGAPHPQIEEIVFDSIPSERVIVDPLTPGRDTLALWFHMPAAELPDTIRGQITYLKHDSVRVLQRVTEPLKLAWRFIETKEQEKEREKNERARAKAEAAGEEWTEPEKPNPFVFKMPLSGDINPQTHLAIDFDYPLVRLDSTAVSLTVEGAEGEQAVPVSFLRDTANLRRWRIEAPWKIASKYKLLIPAGALEDVAGQQNDTIAGSYTTLDPEKYATVKLRLKTRGDGMRYIVQLLDGNSKLLQEKTRLGDTLIQFDYVPAGDIRFRLVEDANGNGRWDTGNMVERRQPERTELYADDEGTDTFATKVNWEFEIEMDMNELFAPVTMQSLVRTLDRREQQRLIKEAEKRAKEGPKKKDDNQRGQSGAAGGMGGFGGIGGMMKGGSGTANRSAANTTIR